MNCIRHLCRRPPRGRLIAWGRKLSMDGQLLTYTIFRRDMRNAVHQKSLQYLSTVAPRKMIAADLKAARKLLRDRVDEIDLQILEAA